MPLDPRGRHAQAAPPPSLGWSCVRCGKQNTGPLEHGCECGAGKPGVHLETPAAQPSPTDPPPAADTMDVDEAFIAWRKQRVTDGLDADTDLYDAFRAGYMVGVAQVSAMAVPLSGTAESRTIVAALKRFKEEVLPLASEEIASGEWLAVAEVDRLIVRLERTGG